MFHRTCNKAKHFNDILCFNPYEEDLLLNNLAASFSMIVCVVSTNQKSISKTGSLFDSFWTLWHKFIETMKVTVDSVWWLL